MPITGDWQASIGGAMIADDNQLHLVKVEGLGPPAPKTQDVSLDQAPGEVFGNDYAAKQVIGLTIIARSAVNCGDKAASAMLAAKSVLSLWSPGGNRTLTIQLPGWGTWSKSGRCRGTQLNMEAVHNGAVPLLLQFEIDTASV